jgi:HlyD family secretion protein
MTRLRLVLAGAVAACLAAGEVRGDDPKPHPGEPRSELITHKVQRGRLSLDIYRRGTLEPMDEQDIICRAKTGPQGSPLLWVIEDGAWVKQGQLLAKIDDGPLREQLRAQAIAIDLAKAAAAAAEENAKIADSQNQSFLEAAKITVELGELDLKKYVEGDYPQALKDVHFRLRLAEDDLQTARNGVNAAERAVKGGTATPDDARAWQSRLLGAEIALDKTKEELRVLEKYTYPRTRRDLESKLDEGKRALARAGDEAKAKDGQAAADRAAKFALLKQEENRSREIENAIRQCQIVAPREGVVIRSTHEQDDRFPPSGSPALAVGQTVREGQKLMAIADLSRMVVSVRIPEAVITRVRVGQAALVRIDAFPGREFRGRVLQVSPRPLPRDRAAAERTCSAQVALDEKPEGIVPGLSADVTLTTGKELDDVLAVPVQALLSPTAAGQRLCVVRTSGGLEQREITLGQSNGKMTEVRSGLKEGEDVVLNPRSLYTERPGRRLP